MPYQYQWKLGMYFSSSEDKDMTASLLRIKFDLLSMEAQILNHLLNILVCQWVTKRVTVGKKVEFATIWHSLICKLC